LLSIEFSSYLIELLAATAVTVVFNNLPLTNQLDHLNKLLVL